MKKIALIIIQLVLLMPLINAQSVAGIQSVSSFEELNSKRNSLNREIAATETMLDEIPDVDTANILININNYTNEISFIDNSLRSVGNTKDSSVQILERKRLFYQQELSRSQNALAEERVMMKNKTDLKNRIENKKEELSKVENDINILLMPKIGQQNFMFYSSIAFVLLMLVLLGTFYYVVKNDEQIRRTIFGGESGIQFIALFSIIIAIILFGLTGVLEGKELAALLGSVAGYILGKAKFASENINSNPPPVIPQPNPANPNQ